jgi:hypothetical protein
MSIKKYLNEISYKSELGKIRSKKEVPKTPIDKKISEIAKMTDRNDHNGARVAGVQINDTKFNVFKG